MNQDDTREWNEKIMSEIYDVQQMINQWDARDLIETLEEIFCIEQQLAQLKRETIQEILNQVKEEAK